MKMLSI